MRMWRPRICQRHACCNGRWTLDVIQADEHSECEQREECEEQQVQLYPPVDYRTDRLIDASQRMGVRVQRLGDKQARCRDYQQEQTTQAAREHAVHDQVLPAELAVPRIKALAAQPTACHRLRAKGP